MIYWIKRNYKHEIESYQMLLACKFVPMQTNNLALEKENAIDFYNYYIKQAGEGWKFEEKDDMNFFKLMEQPFRMCAKIDFCEDTPDEFEIQLYGQAGEEIINFDDIYDTIQSGEKYARVRSLGFVEYNSYKNQLRFLFPKPNCLFALEQICRLVACYKQFVRADNLFLSNKPNLLHCFLQINKEIYRYFLNMELLLQSNQILKML